MTKRIFRTADLTALIAGTAFMVAMTGCTSTESNPHQRYRTRPVVQIQATVVIQDDYDYFPGYEVYYSRAREEYVYRDGRAWVRRSTPPRVTVAVLFASPSVRLDFHDAPSRHHRSVVRKYPKHWAPPDRRDDDTDDHRDGRRDDRRNDKKAGEGRELAP